MTEAASIRPFPDLVLKLAEAQASFCGPIRGGKDELGAELGYLLLGHCTALGLRQIVLFFEYLYRAI